MAATAAQIARLRRMVGEPTDATYDDDAISDAIERYRLIDEQGELPYTLDTSTQPPTEDDNEDWIPTYDLNAAAADIWAEKAAGVSGDFDFSADGGRYTRSQVYEQYMKQSRYYRARRSAATIRMHKSPEEGEDVRYWIANLPESD